MSVIVWEWQESTSLWFPYSPEIASFLETQYQTNARDQCVDIGTADPNLSCYQVNFIKMRQTRKETGMERSVRRMPYPTNHPSASGVVWEWQDDFFTWTPYDVQTSCLLEKNHSQASNTTCIDLEDTHLGIPNMIDLAKMVQINKNSKFERLIQRRVNKTLYPKNTSTSRNDVISGKPILPFTVGNSSASGQYAGPPDKQKSTRNKTKKVKLSSESEKDPLSSFCRDVKETPDEECSICFEKLKDVSGFHDDSSTKSVQCDVKELKKCKHKFHGTCLLELLKSCSKDGWLQCPTCKAIQGVKQGIQPKDGRMGVSKHSQRLPGFPECGMITINYNFRNGIQSQEHPHPGKAYYASGFPRICYLPDNKKGQKVLRLLEEAWNRRLIFTIATSSTTGQSDTIVWNEIHHKTEAFSNESGHGYPDPNYLDNVLKELVIQGVGDDDDD